MRNQQQLDLLKQGVATTRRRFERGSTGLGHVRRGAHRPGTAEPGQRGAREPVGGR